MELYDAMRHTPSCRYFTDEPVPDDTVSSPTLPGADDVGGDGSSIVPAVAPVAQNIPVNAIKVRASQTGSRLTNEMGP